MMVTRGYAELPLHDGHVPYHLLQYMKRLGRAIATYIIDVFGPETLVKRLSDPFWFQAFNNVIGMDWDSSGSTTVVLYVLKSFANVDTFKDIGLAVLGGKGSDSREVKTEVERLSRYGLDTSALSYISKFSAKIDSVAIQDGYKLYIHGLVVSEKGLWTVIQQGMNTMKKMARRYHIHSDHVTIERDPHSGIACNLRAHALNLVDPLSSRTRKTILDLLPNPRQVIRDIATVNRLIKREESLEKWLGRRLANEGYKPLGKPHMYSIPELEQSFYRPITNIITIERTLNILTNRVINTFDDLMVQENVGAEFIRALALVADVIYGDTPSFRDPVTHAIDPFAYSFAHGGKDGIPFPVKFDVMRETIEFLEDAINSANLDAKQKRKALENLYNYWRSLQSALEDVETP